MQETSHNLRFIFSLLIFILLFAVTSLLFFFFVTDRFPIQQTIATSENNISEPIIIIDAGHGGEDGGAIGINGCYEKDINLILAKKLQTQLSAIGIKSILTRSEDILLYDRNSDYQGHKKMLDMKARVKIVEGYENAIFISIHQNTYPVAKYDGFQIYYSQNNTKSKILSDRIEKTVRSLLQPENNRHAKPSGGSIYLLDKINCPAVLLECGFLSNPEECELLSSDSYQNKLVSVIASAISEYITEN